MEANATGDNFPFGDGYFDFRSATQPPNHHQPSSSDLFHRLDSDCFVENFSKERESVSSCPQQNSSGVQNSIMAEPPPASVLPPFVGNQQPQRSFHDSGPPLTRYDSFNGIEDKQVPPSLAPFPSNEDVVILSEGNGNSLETKFSAGKRGGEQQNFVINSASSMRPLRHNPSNRPLPSLNGSQTLPPFQSSSTGIHSAFPNPSTPPAFSSFSLKSSSSPSPSCFSYLSQNQPLSSSPSSLHQTICSPSLSEAIRLSNSLSHSKEMAPVLSRSLPSTPIGSPLHQSDESRFRPLTTTSSPNPTQPTFRSSLLKYPSQQNLHHQQQSHQFTQQPPPSQFFNSAQTPPPPPNLEHQKKLLPPQHFQEVHNSPPPIQPPPTHHPNVHPAPLRLIPPIVKPVTLDLSKQAPFFTKEDELLNTIQKYGQHPITVLRITSCSILLLPTFDLLKTCFHETLTHLFLNNCSSVNDDCLEVISKTFVQLQNLDLSGCFQVSNHGIVHLWRLKDHLLSLDLSYCPISDSGIFQMVHGPDYKQTHLSTRDVVIVEEEKEVVKKEEMRGADSPSSPSISVHQNIMKRSGDPLLIDCPATKKRKLKEEGSPLLQERGAEGAEGVEEKEKEEKEEKEEKKDSSLKWAVRSFNFSYCCGLKGDISRWLSPHLFPLTSINLQGCTKIHKDSLRSLIMSSPHLTSVNFSFLSIRDPVLFAIADNCPHLSILDLSHTLVSGEGVQRVMCASRGLKELNLDRCINLKGSDVRQALIDIQKHIQRRVEAKQRFQQNGGDIEFINVDCGPDLPKGSSDQVEERTLTNPPKLKIEYDDSVPTILEKRGDEEISGQLPETAREEMSGQSQIEKLNLSACEVTDEDLAVIGLLCPFLSDLDISSCPSLSQTAIAKLCGQCLRLKFVGVWNCRVDSRLKEVVRGGIEIVGVSPSG